RRRHTRWPRDWSSDVCSSDLGQFLYVGTTQEPIVARVNIQAWTNDLTFGLGSDFNGISYIVGDFAPLPGQPHSIAVSMHTWYGRSEERRVGKETRRRERASGE